MGNDVKYNDSSTRDRYTDCLAFVSFVLWVVSRDTATRHVGMCFFDSSFPHASEGVPRRGHSSFSLKVPTGKFSTAISPLDEIDPPRGAGPDSRHASTVVCKSWRNLAATSPLCDAY